MRRLSDPGVRASWIVKRLLLRAVYPLLPQSDVFGFRIINLTDSWRDETLLSKLREAFELIRTLDPRRFARMQRDVKRVVVVPYSGPEYIHAVRACMLSSEYVRKGSAEALALTLVHEATHARLMRAGIGYEGPLRERVERVCVESEVRFARLLPDSADRVARAYATLRSPWWTDEKEFEERIRQYAQLGWPRWYIKAYAWLRRP